MLLTQRLLAIARKEFHHIVRDSRTLFLVTIAPAFLLLTLAYVFSFDADHFTLAIMDQDNSELSRQYIEELTSDGTFRVIGFAKSYKEIDTWLLTGQAQIALVIPSGATDGAQTGRTAPMQAILDGVDAIAANQALGQINARTNAFSLKLLLSANNPKRPTLAIHSKVWYNPSLKSLNSMVPGLIAVVLTMPALALALSLAREKELGSFESLSATHLEGLEYLLGKAITYVGFGLTSTLPILAVATVWFHVPFRGDLFTLLLLTMCYFSASFGISMLIANFVKNQQTTMLILILMFFVPSFFLAGLILPIDTGSLGAQLAAYSLPATHFIVICRGIFLKGLDATGLLLPTFTLLSIGSVTLALSLTLFNKWIE